VKLKYASNNLRIALGRFIATKYVEFVFNAVFTFRDHSRAKSNAGSYKRPYEEPSRPVELSIEVTNICNANCTFCGYQYQQRPTTIMSFDLFKMAIDQYVKIGGGRLGLTPIVGDALVDRHLHEKIAYARRFPQITQIGITTNGILLNRKRFEEIVHAGITKIDISMTGFNREEYERIYRVRAYEKVMRNLNEIAQSSLFSKCDVSVGLRTDTVFPQLKAEYKRVKRLGYKFTRSFKFDSWSGRIKTEDLSGVMLIRPNRSSQKKRIPCSMLYSGPTVMADGRLTACGCRDLNVDSDLTLGNIRKTSIDSAWIDGTMKKLRQRFTDGNPPDICKDCRHYNPVK
jgi:MoaA/NifB/PqqE/SkfB family radical SAM enzyme